MAEFSLGRRWRLQGGLRFEKSQIRLRTLDPYKPALAPQVTTLDHAARLLAAAARLILLLPALLLAGWWVAAQLRPPRLRHGASSPEELARKVLDGLQAGDLQTLASLALSADEFREFVWPELPVSNPRTNVPPDYVWGDVHVRSTARLQSMLRALKGERFSLVRVRHTGPRTDYPTHRAYSDFEIVLRDRDGKEREYLLFGTLIEMDGVWKVYSYAPYD